MPFSAAEERRVVALERAINRLATAVSNLAPKEDLNRYVTIRQADIADLQTRLDAAELAIALLQRR